MTRLDSERRPVEVYDGKAVGVVVPVYNEERFVGEVIETMPEFVDGVFVVDDCSDDASWEEILAHAGEGVQTAESSTALEPTLTASTARGEASWPDGGSTETQMVVPARHESNVGRGGAVKTGYDMALENGMDVVAVMDGDGQMDPDNLDAIVDPVAAGEAGYAKADRLSSGADRGKMPGWRLFGNVLLTGLTKVASGYWDMRDPQNGYTAISSDVLERLEYDDLYEGYGFLNDLLIRLGCYGVSVADVPMDAVYGEETSGIRYRTFVPRLSLLLLRGFLRRVWTKSVWMVSRRTRQTG